MTDTLIYKVDNTVTDEAWARAKYGAEFIDSDGERKHVLESARETHGPASVIVRLVDENNRPLPNYAVAFCWKGGEHSLESEEAKAAWATRPAPRATIQFTDGGGVTGFGLGMGSYIYDLNVGGPHAICILDRVPSDVAARIGMVAGTDHHGILEFNFKLMNAMRFVPDVNQAIREDSWKSMGIPLNPGAAFQRYANANGLGIPFGDERDVRLNGKTYRTQAFAGGIVMAEVGQWDKVTHIKW